MSGACFPVGRCTLLVHHHGISQPNPASWRLASSSQALSGPCYSHHRVVHDAEAQRLMEYLYTPRYCYISPLCFTAQRRLQVHDPLSVSPCPCPKATRFDTPIAGNAVAFLTLHGLNF